MILPTDLCIGMTSHVEVFNQKITTIIKNSVSDIKATNLNSFFIGIF